MFFSREIKIETENWFLISEAQYNHISRNAFASLQKYMCLRKQSDYPYVAIATHVYLKECCKNKLHNPGELDRNFKSITSQNPQNF